MALAHAPRIITNGLIFYYDMENQRKSWKGAPTTNLYADGDFSSESLHPVRSGNWEIVPDPRNPTKRVLKTTPRASNQYHGRDIPVTTSTLYSMQMEVFASPDFNGTNLQMYPEQGGGGANRSYDLSKKGTWQTLRFDGKSATTANIRLLAYVLSSFTTGYVLVSNVQIEQSAIATPFVNGTRSNTQAILDLTGNTTVTATSLTYNSDGTFEFDGSNNYSLISNPVTNGQPYTILMMVKPDSLGTAAYNSSSGRKTFLKGDGHWNPGIWVTQNTFRSHCTTEYRDTNINWSDLRTSYVGMIFDGTNCFNVFDATIQTSARTAYSPGVPTNILIGAENSSPGAVNWDGKIYSMQYYNRALSAEEIRQNFNALRGRYGI